MRVLKGVSLELHELKEKHLPQLFEWRNSRDFMELCSTRRNSVSFKEFQGEICRDFNNDRHVQFMIVRRERYIGTIYSYNLNRTDGHVFVTIFLAKTWRDKGYGAEAMTLFLEHLFREFELFKVYVEVYSYNLESLQALIGGKFVEEGRFQGHRVNGNGRHDLIRLAFFRRQLGDFAPLLKKLTKRNPHDWI